MYCAVHAERTGAHSLFTALRRVSEGGEEGGREGGREGGE